MDELTLIDNIDEDLKECTGMNRNGHYQVQQIMQTYRQQAKMRLQEQHVKQTSEQSNDKTKGE